MFVPGRPFQLSIIFVGVTRSLLKSGKPERFTSIRQAIALLANNRLRWKGLPVANTLAHYKYSKITFVKSFVTFVPEDRENVLEVDALFRKIWKTLTKVQ